MDTRKQKKQTLMQFGEIKKLSLHIFFFFHFVFPFLFQDQAERLYVLHHLHLYSAHPHRASSENTTTRLACDLCMLGMGCVFGGVSSEYITCVPACAGVC